jgi:hypothetical protein
VQLRKHTPERGSRELAGPGTRNSLTTSTGGLKMAKCMANCWLYGSHSRNALRVVSVAALLLTSSLVFLQDTASASGGNPPGTLLTTLDNPTGSGGQGFGNEVAISETMEVPAPGVSSGEVFVYKNGSSGWPSTPSQTLTNPSPESGGKFGTAIATNGPVLAVANTDADNYSASTVDVYFYDGSSFESTPTDVLQSPTGSADFGYSLAVWDGTILVGAPSTSGAGFAYIFPAESSKTVTEQDPANLAGDGFGDSVAVLGRTAVVGSPGRAGPGDTGVEGRAFVYTKSSGSGWPTSPSTSIADPVGDPTDQFGASVSLSTPKLGSSSASTLAVGAPSTATSAGPDAGAAYIYLKGSTAWPKKPTVSLADPTSPPSDFGTSVALSTTFLVVCAPGVNDNDGAAYIYKRVNTAAWPKAPTLSLRQPGTSDGSAQFCADSSISTSIAFIGASNGDMGIGTAYVFKV